MKAITIALFSSALFAGPAYANFSCPTNPSSYLGLDASGWVAVEVDGVGVQKICSVSSTQADVTAASCEGWYASLLTARATGHQGLLYFNPDNPTNNGATACTQLTQWGASAPYFLELN